MIEVMKARGGIGYSISHMGKEHLQAEGRLSLALCITADLFAETKALIEKRTARVKGGNQEIEKGIYITPYKSLYTVLVYIVLFLGS
jgi:hypothetical protein